MPSATSIARWYGPVGSSTIRPAVTSPLTLNILFGLWLVVAPLFLDGGTIAGNLLGVASGLVLIPLSLPRGRRSKEHYGSWDRYIV